LWLVLALLFWLLAFLWGLSQKCLSVGSEAKHMTGNALEREDHCTCEAGTPGLKEVKE
jgi:hypothetical protein